MKRRDFINTAALTGLGLSLSSFASKEKKQKRKNSRGTFSQKGNHIGIYTNTEIQPTRLFHITDTHLSIDDERGIKYQDFSKRMAGAYKSNVHFQTQQSYTTKESFLMTLNEARQQEVDLLALTGDIFSFPSEAAVEWALQKLKETEIPFAYIAGNHDWHYEGMKGSSKQLRATWVEKHLKPMYQGKHPLYSAYDINGVRFICIDNSTYEILPEQLDFFTAQTKSNIPLILLIHIPLYMPGSSRGYGCASPHWGAKTDKNFKLERRERWRKGGHTKVTFDFHKEVFNAPNLLAVFAGHTHRAAIDIKNGIPQVVSGHNATGYYTDVTINSV